MHLNLKFGVFDCKNTYYVLKEKNMYLLFMTYLSFNKDRFLKRFRNYLSGYYNSTKCT